GRNNELSLLDVGKQDIPGAGEEELGVVVVGAAGERFEVEGTGAAGEVKLLGDELALELSYLVVVEGRVIVDVLGAVDQAVVCDDRCILLLGLFEDRSENFTVDGGDHEDLGSAGDLVLDLADLLVSLVVCVLQVNGAVGV